MGALTRRTKLSTRIGASHAGYNRLMSHGQRRSCLSAALGFALLEPHHREVRLLHSWLSTWTGIGHVIAGMHRQGYDVQLTQYDERGWRATFYVTGMEHSATSASASAWEATPWRAIQAAAWEALTKG
jgi:hypothetical protein